jgi:hypothetical protein
MAVESGPFDEKVLVSDASLIKYCETNDTGSGGISLAAHNDGMPEVLVVDNDIGSILWRNLLVVEVLCRCVTLLVQTSLEEYFAGSSSIASNSPFDRGRSTDSEIYGKVPTDLNLGSKQEHAIHDENRRHARDDEFLLDRLFSFDVISTQDKGCPGRERLEQSALHALEVDAIHVVALGAEETAAVANLGRMLPVIDARPIGLSPTSY